MKSAILTYAFLAVATANAYAPKAIVIPDK